MICVKDKKLEDKKKRPVTDAARQAFLEMDKRGVYDSFLKWGEELFSCGGFLGCPGLRLYRFAEEMKSPDVHVNPSDRRNLKLLTSYAILWIKFMDGRSSGLYGEERILSLSPVPEVGNLLDLGAPLLETEEYLTVAKTLFRKYEKLSKVYREDVIDREDLRKEQARWFLRKLADAAQFSGHVEWLLFEALDYSSKETEAIIRCSCLFEALGAKNLCEIISLIANKDIKVPGIGGKTIISLLSLKEKMEAAQT